MQAASHGARALAHKPPNIGHATRNIHIPAAIRPRAPTLGQKLLSHTRWALNRFVTHLTTPGIGSTPSVSVTRAYHAANPTIQQRLSFGARNALSRPLRPQFLPRGPVVPRTMTQVGLGTARNFTTGRPIFQQLAENVPIAGRAFYEADWDLEMHQEKERMRRPTKKAGSSTAKKGKEMMKPKAAKPVVAKVAEQDELEHYFASPSVPDVTTFLLVPLAPTPTDRVPLPEFPVSTSSTGRLSLPSLLDIHDKHETHGLRVSALFRRLDAAQVWSRGAVSSAYSNPTHDGVCTVLRVTFHGWSMAAVRGVIGECGTGWCVMEEEYGSASQGEDSFSDTSSVLSGMASGLSSPPAVDSDPAQSLILPTLDFSASFMASNAWASESRASPPSFGRLDSGVWSDAGSDISAHTDFAFVDPPSENGWFEGHMSETEDAFGSADPWLDSESESLSTPNSVLGLSFSSAFSNRLAESSVST